MIYGTIFYYSIFPLGLYSACYSMCSDLAQSLVRLLVRSTAFLALFYFFLISLSFPLYSLILFYYLFL